MNDVQSLINYLYVLAQLNLTINIRSEGANDPGIHGNGHASIQLNGAEKAKRRRGYNVVVVNGETGK